MAAHQEMMSESRSPLVRPRNCAARGSPGGRLGLDLLDQLPSGLALRARTFWRSPGFTLGAIARLSSGRREPCRVPGLSTPGSSTACHFKARPYLRFSRIARTRNLRRLTPRSLSIARTAVSAARALENTGLQVIVRIEGGLRNHLRLRHYFGALRILPRLGAPAY